MITDCDVDTGDDAICIKSNNLYSDQKVARNIVVTNCILASPCNGFKIGSEGPSGFENITFPNSVIYSRKELRDDQRVISAIDIVMPDGGVA
jgi:polygalacturonase